MIDLEEALTTFVERAPEPPSIDGVVRRGRQRRRHRRGVAFATTLVVLVAGVGAANAVVSARRTPHVAGPPNIERVRVTMLDGSQLEISGPATLGLTKLSPAFNAELDSQAANAYQGHAFTIARDAPDELGAEVGRYPTGDGVHGLVEYATATGVAAVVRYDEWTLVAPWGTHQTNWSAFAAALRATETPDGFLVIDPALPDWKLGPTDAPDVQLGGDAYGSDAAFSFFGPSTYPAGCPKASETATRTAQGWPVSSENGTWWCDADSKVRVRIGDPELADAAIDGLRVRYTPPAR